jgi:hypothetical protein
LLDGGLLGKARGFALGDSKELKTGNEMMKSYFQLSIVL